jgi:hypothetical protein
VGRIIRTIKGLQDTNNMARTLEFKENDNEFVLAIEWRLNGELVRRDAHVILKEPSVVADAIAQEI